MEEFIEREGGDFNAFYQECRVKQDDGTPHEKVRCMWAERMPKKEGTVVVCCMHVFMFWTGVLGGGWLCFFCLFVGVVVFWAHNTLVQHFLKLLLASADYKDFSRIMVREASFYYATGTSSFGRLPAEDEARLQAEANKEADESPSKK